MILPIVAYGSPVLKKKASLIATDYPNLKTMVGNMWETMYAAKGVGLAAPQIGESIRLFVVDASPFAQADSLPDEENEFLKQFKKVFINPVVEKEEGKEWGFSEGCLSIPSILEEVVRKECITISYLDENFEQNKLRLSGLAARVVQHEYDHVEGVLFTDRLSLLKKRVLKGKLDDISKGIVKAEYLMKFHSYKK